MVSFGETTNQGHGPDQPGRAALVPDTVSYITEKYRINLGSELAHSCGQVSFEKWRSLEAVIQTLPFVPKHTEQCILWTLCAESIGAVATFTEKKGQDVSQTLEKAIAPALAALGRDASPSCVAAICRLAIATANQGWSIVEVVTESIIPTIKGLGAQPSSDQVDLIERIILSANTTGERYWTIVQQGLIPAIKALGKQATVNSLASLERICNAAQGRGEELSGVFCNGILPALRALGGSPSEETVNIMATVAVASVGQGKRIASSLSYGLAPAIAAVGRSTNLVDNAISSLRNLTQHHQDSSEILPTGFIPVVVPIGRPLHPDVVEALREVIVAAATSELDISVFLAHGLAPALNALRTSNSAELVRSTGLAVVKICLLAKENNCRPEDLLESCFSPLMPLFSGKIELEQIQTVGAGLVNVMAALNSHKGLLGEVTRGALIPVLKELGNERTPANLTLLSKIACAAGSRDQDAASFLYFDLSPILKAGRKFGAKAVLEMVVTVSIALEQYGLDHRTVYRFGVIPALKTKNKDSALSEIGRVIEAALIAKEKSQDVGAVLRLTYIPLIAEYDPSRSIEIIKELAWQSSLPSIPRLDLFKKGELSQYLAALRGAKPEAIQERIRLLSSGIKKFSDPLDKALLIALIDSDATYALSKEKHASLLSRSVLDLEPVFVFQDDESEFHVKVRGESDQFKVRVGRAQDPGLVRMCTKLFYQRPETLERIESQLRDNLGLSPKDDLLQGAVRAIKLTPETDKRASRSLLNSLTPLLPQLCQCNLPDLYSGDDVEERRRFLSKIQDQVLSHVRVMLEHLGLNIETLEDQANIKLVTLGRGIAAELAKYKLEYSGRFTGRLIATKGLIDLFYGDLGDCCIVSLYGSELSRSDFQPIRMIDPKTNRQLGVAYATFSIIAGQKALVLAGIEPKRFFSDQVDPNSLVAALIESLGKIARRTGYRLYTNVGSIDWKDDGRIAQRSEIRDALRRFCTGRTPISLEKQDEIKFPARFGRPIEWVIALD